MHAVAGNKPFRPFRPPMHGDSKSPELKLLWNGSSHARFCHSSETHLKQSIPASETKCNDDQGISRHNNVLC